MILASLLASLLALSLAAETPRFAGVDLPGGTRVTGVDVPLMLRGTTVIEGADANQLYAVALYADRRMRSDRDLVDALEPCKLTLIWIDGDMTEAEVRQHFTMRFIKTVSSEHYSQLAPAIERLVATLPTVQRGSQWHIEYWPDGGMVWITDTQRQRVPGIDMSRAVLGLWVGDRAEPKVRASLLPARTSKP